MDKFDIQKLRELPIESVSERLGLRVNRHKATCPFHDDQHPSLYFNVARNTYRCYACGAHGGVLDLAMHELNKPFYETCQWLANENNIILSGRVPVLDFFNMSVPKKLNDFFLVVKGVKVVRGVFFSRLL